MIRKPNPYKKFIKGEAAEHVRIVEFLRTYEPVRDEIWFHPVNEGERSPFEQYLFGVMGGLESIPDFIFLSPRKGFHGMLLEHKKLGTVIYNKDGTPRAAVAKQHKLLKKLDSKGYFTDFTVGYDDCITIIKNYYE